MDPTSFASFQKDTSAALVNFIKAAKSISAGDISFNKSLDSDFSTTLDTANGKILGLINDLVRNAAHGSDIKFENFEDAESLEARWSTISEVVDFLLEKADMCMDEYTGTVKRGVMQTTSAGNNYKSAKDKRTPEGRKAFNKTLHMPKPQLQFKKSLSPLDSSPYKPRLVRKPHAIKSLEESMSPTVVDGRDKYPHPYLEEISQYTFPERVRKEAEPIKYHPFESTSAIWVDTTEKLEDMLQQLLKAEEIAVDLEHHDYRTFIGLVCLMQISTRDQDWIIDTLKLREELEVLNQVFANPNIIKVFHGAFMDIIWLQRDLNIYVVGLFDTYEAARSLGFTGHSLAFLLKKYIDFDADKSYQLADWRVRPIPQDMLNYARSDTHFLLYIYDNMRNELLQKSNEEEDKIETVLSHSKETCLKTYDTEPYDSVNGAGSRGWLSILKHNPIHFSDEQFSAFKAIHAWRDSVARQEDDNPNFVLSRNHLLSLARQMPADSAAVLAVCNSPLIRAKLADLVTVIKEARENPIPFSSIQHLLASQGKYWTPQGKKEEQAPTEVNPLPMLDAEDGKAKTDKSQFWGNTFGSSRWEVKDLVNGVGGISLALPLPNLRARIMKDPKDPGPSAPIPPPTYVKDREVKDETPDIIVVRQLGGGRKRKLQEVVEDALGIAEARSDGDEAAQPDNLPDAAVPSGNPTHEGGDDDEEEGAVLLSREERRAAKKAEKKRKKEEAKRNQAQAAANAGEYQPFDYASAPSVMNAKRESESQAFDGSKKYDGGPKGLRARKREKDGKSFTMKA
ncbi:hypothetical protein ABW19_dt0202972 [Dactylella cylindrospora]|nr:hypothetical protein ABW19_dt0202972 [Dactylella cylindrospora]